MHKSRYHADEARLSVTISLSTMSFDKERPREKKNIRDAYSIIRAGTGTATSNKDKHRHVDSRPITEERAGFEMVRVRV